MKDKTLGETFEAVLDHADVKDSEEIAEMLMEAYNDWVTDVWPRLAMKALDCTEGWPRMEYEVGDKQ